jgi:hypothetical protein
VEIADVEVRYPFTHDSVVPFIAHDVETHNGSDGEPHHRYCFTCTFRPWAAHGEVVEAAVTVHRADGTTTTHAATFDDDTGRWVAEGLSLSGDDRVTVQPGQVVDAFGNVNGQEATS